MIKAYKNRRSVKTDPRSGRPRKVSVREETMLLLLVEKNREKVYKLLRENLMLGMINVA